MASRSKQDRHRHLIEFTGARIRRARESLGMSQADLLAGSGVGRTIGWISDIERGVNSIDPHDLFILARHLGRPVEWFIDPAFDKRSIRAPLTITEWEQMYDDRERAEAHFLLDRVFERALARIPEPDAPIGSGSA